MKKILVVLASFCFSANLYAFGVGYSAHPLLLNTKVVSAEFTGVTSEEGGVGLLGRYTHQYNQQTSFDGGFGLASGERGTFKLFGGVDYELFPDYLNQPRFSVKSTVDYISEFGDAHALVTVTPTMSKGLSFWGNEGFPYIAMPIGLDLNTDFNTYRTFFNLSLGLTGRLPIEGYDYLTASTEIMINIDDSYSGISFGVSYPLNL